MMTGRQRRRILINLAICVMVFLGLAGTALSIGALDHTQATIGANLVVNGNFTKWCRLTKQEKWIFTHLHKPTEHQQAALNALRWPQGWWLWAGNADGAVALRDTGIFPDYKIKRLATCSVRMECRSSVSSMNLVQRIKVQPNMCYRIQMWLRGRNLEPYAGKGVALLMIASCYAKPDFNNWSGVIKDRYKFPCRGEKASPWRHFRYSFDTTPKTKSIVLIISLRGAGALWISNVQVTPVHKIVPVKSF